MYCKLTIRQMVVFSNTSCKGLITTAEGKFFSNGLDLQWLSQMDKASSNHFIMVQFDEMLGRLLTFPLPTIAAINGQSHSQGFVSFPEISPSEPYIISPSEPFSKV